MRISDLCIEGKGLLHFVNIITPMPFEEIQNIDMLDKLFLLSFGERRLSPMARIVFKDGVDSGTMLDMGLILSSKFSKKWIELFNIIDGEVPLENYNMYTTETIDGTEMENIINSNTSNSKDGKSVSGFNSDIMVDDESTEINISDSGTNDSNKESLYVKTIESKGNTHNALVDRKNVVEYRKANDIINLIYDDLADILGVMIY